MSKNEPFLRPDDFPNSLWVATHDNGPEKPKGLLCLPGALQEAYRKMLIDRGLFKQAQNIQARESEGPVGGKTITDTLEHFAGSYSGSCGRIQLFALDPRRTFGTTLDSFIALFSGGTVRLLDLPCGAGAASAVLLSTIAELRQTKALPSYPLKVHILGGDISTTAVALANSIHEELKHVWQENSIDANWSFKEWDVLDLGETDNLLDEWQDGTTSGDRHALVIANFSGFLGDTVDRGEPKRWFHDAAASIASTFLKANKLGAVAYWIEPASKKARNVVFPNFNKDILSKIQRLRHLQQSPRSSEAQLRDPVIDGGEFMVRTCGIHLRTNANE